MDTLKDNIESLKQSHCYTCSFFRDCVTEDFDVIIDCMTKIKTSFVEIDTV